MPAETNGPVSPPMTKDQLSRFEDIVANVMTSRSTLLKTFLDPRRDIDADCGYPTGYVPSNFYQELYDREAIATRTVQVLPRESWQVYPWVFEDESPDTVTEFEKAWDVLGKDLRGGSYYQDEEGSPVWEFLVRADELSGIGHYGILLLGLNDGKDLDQEASYSLGQKILYLRAFPESLAQITKYEDNPNNPRFGHPTEYLITFNDPRGQSGSVGLTTSSRAVHWSRVIHFADNLDSSEVYGVPRMQAVLNRLLDLRKLYSGSAEMYWRGAFPGLSIETHPSLGGEVALDIPSMRDNVENYMNSLQRYMSFVGMSAKSLAPQVVDPTSQIMVQIEAICIKLGIPKRVFLGSERGELASSQDDAAWNDRMRARQRTYITPRIIVPFVDRLIDLGVLPKPKGFSVEWPNLDSLSDQEQANIGATQTNSLSQYVSAGIGQIMAPADYLTRIMKMTEEEANTVIRNAEELAEKRLEEEEALREAELEAQVTADIPLVDPETGLPVPVSKPGIPTKSKLPLATGAKPAKAPKTPRAIGGRPPTH